MTCSLLLLCIVASLSQSVGHTVSIPNKSQEVIHLDLDYFLPDDSRPHTVRVDFTHGSSVYELTKELCSLTEKDLCIKTMDALNSMYYNGMMYTPSRKTSTTEDFYATRTDVLLYLHERYNLRNYLEIGCQLNQNFDKVRNRFDIAIGVDPASGGTHRMTSDEFFFNNTQMFDLIFIDGLHEGHQVLRDVVFALRFLNPKGFIVMHDLNPRDKLRQIVPMLPEVSAVWNGDSWRAAVAMRLMDHLEIVVADFDHGVGIARRRPNLHRLPMDLEVRLIDNPVDALTYEDLDTNRDKLLRLMSFSEVRAWLDEVE